jgi:hypothetical protein
VRETFRTRSYRPKDPPDTLHKGYKTLTGGIVSVGWRRLPIPFQRQGRRCVYPYLCFPLCLNDIFKVRLYLYLYLYNNTILFIHLLYAQEAEPPLRLFFSEKSHVWNSTVHYHFHSNISVSILSQIIIVHILPFTPLRFTLILSSHQLPGVLSRYSSQKFDTQACVYFCSPPLTRRLITQCT